MGGLTWEKIQRINAGVTGNLRVREGEVGSGAWDSGGHMAIWVSG